MMSLMALKDRVLILIPGFPLALNIKGPWDPQSAKMGGHFQN